MHHLFALITLLATMITSAPPSELITALTEQLQSTVVTEITPVPAQTVAPDEAGQVAVLLYHHLATSDEMTEGPGVISPQRFESHLHMLRANGYSLITAADFAAFLDGQKAVPDRSVLITFDDGYASNYHHGLPLLRQYEAPALVFPVMKYFATDGKGAYSPHLTREQAAEMLATGLVTFGSHTYDGHHLLPTDPLGEVLASFLAGRIWLADQGRAETPEESEARVRADLERSAVALRDLGLIDPWLHFALPYGHGAERADLLRSLGFRYIYTIEDAELNWAGQAKLVHRVDGGNPAVSAEVLQSRLEALFSQPPASERLPLPR